MSKSFITNLISVVVILLSFFLIEPYKNIVLMTGLFALSGAVTNWIAVHMLFEKVPFLYGSGVVINRFEDFKLGIHGLIMNQFFTKENIERFFTSSDSKNEINLAPVIEKTDLTPAFESLKSAVMESKFGGMLSMFGGALALDGLKDSFEVKMKSALIKITLSQSFQKILKDSIASGTITHDMLVKIDSIVSSRLDELTPNMVKEIIQKMIKEHLGWLVVWGGVFGGFIGLISSFFL